MIPIAPGKWLPWLHEKGFFHLLSANFLTQFLGFGTSLLVAKLLSPVELGEIKILQSYTTLFIILAIFGLDTATLKFCAENRTQEDRESILRLSLKRASAATLVALLLLAILLSAGVITNSSHLAIWMIVYALVIPFAVAAAILMVYLQALKRIKEMARSQALIKAQSFLVIIACTWLWGFRGFVFATIFAYMIALIPLLLQVGTHFRHAVSHPVPVGFTHLALFSLLATGFSAISQYGDILVLDHFTADRAAIGYYSLAITFTLAAIQITGTVQAIVTPYFSARSRDAVWVRQQIRRNQTRLIGLSLGVALVVYALAWGLVHTVYGGRYLSVLSYLQVLLLKYVVWSSYAVIGAALVGLGLTRQNFLVVAVTVPIGLLLSYTLLQRFGVIGVAWAQVAAALLNLVLMLIMQRFALRHYFASLSTAETTAGV